MRKLVSGAIPIVVVACLLTIVGVSPAEARGPQKKGRGVLEVVCVDRGDQSLRVPSGACARDEERVRVSVAERLRVRRGLLVPNNDGAWFCAAPGRGALRVIDRPGQCKKGTALESRNHRPDAPELSDTSVPEGVPVGTAVGTLTADDQDTADRMTYQVIGGDVDTFQVVDGALVTAAPLDFETRTDYRVRVQVTDLLGLTRAATYDLTVTDAEENRPPTDVSLDASAVPENAPAGTLVGRLGSTDPDAGDAHTYTLVTEAGVPNANPLFSIVGDQLRTVAPFDFEQASALGVRVRTDDGAGGSFEKDLAVAVTDAPDAPTGITLSPSTVREGVTGLVGTLTATDQDADEQHTFSLVAGGRDNAMFAISGNRLDLSTPADFESRSELVVRVRVTDKAGLAYEQPVTVRVSDAPEAPTGVTLSPSSVRENEPAGTLVGALAATGADAGGVQFALVTGTGDDDNAAFRIQGTDLLTTESFDYESDAGRSVRVRATDSEGRFIESVLAVAVVNKNEAATRLDLSSSTVAEDAVVGAVVGTLSTDDPDLSDPITYTLLDDAAGRFAVDGDELVTAAGLDHEVATSHTVEVRAEDAGGERVEGTFVIAVQNVNEAPSAPGINDDTVEENLATGAAVGQLTATDPDGGDTLSYTLVAGNGADDNHLFEVDGTTLRTSAAFDHETKATYSIRVRVTDSGTPARFTEAVLTIHVDDVNEAPSQPSLSPSSIAENQAPGTLVGTLSASDPDAGDALTYALVDGLDSEHFSIVAGGVYALDSFDFEGEDSYSIEVEVTDGDETASATLTVTVTDANDAPSGVSLAHASIAENAAARAIGTLSTSDQDAGDSHTYSLPDGEADNDEFVVVGDELRSAGPFDHETQPTREVLVRSTDEAGVHVEKTFTITVDDVNEAPTAISLSGDEVDENVAAQDVGTLSASDPDGGTMTYALVSGPGDGANGSFEISGTTLRAIAAFDFETQPTLSLRIRVTDSGGLSHVQVFTLDVVDADDRPTGLIFRSGGSIAENQAAGTEVGWLDIVDVDGQDPVVYSLVDGAGAFTVSAAGQVTTTGALDFETTPEVTIRVAVSDGDTTTYTGDVVVTVTNRNESPSRVDLSATSVDENEPAGTVVGTLTAVDSDAEPQQPTFELVQGDAQFEIDGNKLVTKAAFDHETTASYAIRVRATDAAGESVETSMTITVGQVNETPSITPPTLSVAENRPADTTVGTIVGTDPESDALTWSLVSGTGSADNAKFTITSAGVLKTAAGLDFETDAELQVRVAVSDGALTTELAVTVSVLDVNDAPTPADDSFTGAIGNTTARFGAGSTGGALAYTTLTGTVLTGNDTDADAGDTVSIVANDGIPTALGGVVELDAGGNFMYYPPAGVKNREDRFSYQVKDSQNAYGTAEVTITIADRRVWYVGSIGAGGIAAGTSSEPFPSFTQLNGVNDADGTGDEIFLYSNVTGALALEQDQRLLGSSAGLPGVTLLSGIRPRLTASSAGYAVSLANGSTVDGVELYADGANDVVRASSVTTATIASGAAIRQDGSGTAVQISGAAGGDILIGSAVAVTATGRAVSVSGRTSGTVAFSRTVSTANATAGGVALSGNTGATVSFAAVLLSGVGPAFSATGGGTVTVSGVNSTLRSTAGTALTVQNTTIGAAGLTFQRIDSSGGSNGILLRNTGTSGSLTVTGNSTGMCGGTLTATGAPNMNPVDADCTGGLISASTGSGISLENTTAPSFTRIRVTGSGDDGISARNVAGLTVVNSNISSNGNAEGENGVDLGGSDATPYAGVTGTVTITDTAIGGSGDTNLFSGTSSGTTTLSLLRNRIYGTTAAGAKDGIRVHATSGGTVDLTVTGSFVTGNVGEQVQVVSSGTGTVQRAAISRNTTWAGGRGIQLAAGGNPFTGTLAFDVADNAIRSISGPAVAVIGTNVDGTGYAGHVRRNIIGTNGVAGSCASAGDGVLVSTEDGSGALTVGIADNTVNRCVGRGVAVEAIGTAAVNATVVSNTVSLADPTSSEALRVELGAGITDTGRSCLSASGNLLTGGPDKVGDLRLVHNYGVLDVAGMVGTPNASSVVLSLSNAHPGAAVSISNVGGGTFAGVSTCPTAPN
ncbi:cadherin domain-containing protein [Nocardioides caricicola]|uniref:Cadherin domain-containing protein n=1 Tax=Nocardioides caricicola TaxID=634770 RepID=A0ABW0N3C4_9ACTN